MPYYAVARGRKKGIYETWDECKKQIENFSHAKYKKFATEAEAKLFIQNAGLLIFGEEDDLKVIDNGLDIKSVSSNIPINNSSENNTAINNLAERINTLEDQLLSILSEVKSIKSSLQDLSSSTCLSNSNALKRKNPFEENKMHIKKIDKVEKNFEALNDMFSDRKNDKIDGNIKGEFKYDSDGFVEVYTDGACEKNGRAKAKAGLGVFFGEGHPLNIGEPCKGRATNNCGEIQAAIKAVKLAKLHGVRKLCIYTDSQFLINSMTRWIAGWKKKGWKLKDGNPVKNKVDFEELDKEIKNMLIKWIYVKAHCGIFGNEMADKLARQGAEKYISPLQ